jgi:hypothetical protein
MRQVLTQIERAPVVYQALRNFDDSLDNEKTQDSLIQLAYLSDYPQNSLQVAAANSELVFEVIPKVIASLAEYLAEVAKIGLTIRHQAKDSPELKEILDTYHSYRERALEIGQASIRLLSGGQGDDYHDLKSKHNGIVEMDKRVQEGKFDLQFDRMPHLNLFFGKRLRIYKNYFSFLRQMLTPKGEFFDQYLSEFLQRMENKKIAAQTKLNFFKEQFFSLYTEALENFETVCDYVNELRKTLPAQMQAGLTQAIKNKARPSLVVLGAQSYRLFTNPYKILQNGSFQVERTKTNLDERLNACPRQQRP